MGFMHTSTTIQAMKRLLYGPDSITDKNPCTLCMLVDGLEVLVCMCVSGLSQRRCVGICVDMIKFD